MGLRGRAQPEFGAQVSFLKVFLDDSQHQLCLEQTKTLLFIYLECTAAEPLLQNDKQMTPRTATCHIFVYVSRDWTQTETEILTFFLNQYHLCLIYFGAWTKLQKH